MPSIDDDALAAILGQVESQSSQPPIIRVPEDDEPLPIPQTDRQPDFNPPELDTSGDDFDSIMESMGANIEPDATDIMKAWMNYHKFVVVETLAELTEVVDQALKSGKCSLDLETEGLDNRIYWKNTSEIKVPVEHWNDVRPEVIPTTVHKIVGYCLSYDGYTGYYVPVRHSAPGEEIINIDPIEAGKEIKRLCLASQPVVSSEGKKKDPLGSPLLEKQGKVKIYFWHAKFDQEFLYPVTGIDFWHPESFEDGLLIYYCIFTGDKSLGLKEKAKGNLWVVDKNGNTVRGHIRSDPKNPLHELVEEDPKGSPIQYEMIKLKDLFVKGREIKFATLKPSEARYYACSDAICTFLLCDKPEILSITRDPRYANIYRLEKQVSQVLRWMERLRIKIDHDYVRNLLTEAKAEADVYRKQIVELAAAHGFNNFDPQSTQQLSNFLFANPTGLNIEPKPDKTSAVGSQQYKTDADTLEKLVEEHPDINPILLVIVKYRQIEKVIGTYLEGMLNNCDANQELRYQFKQTGAPTGRFTAPAGEASQGYGAVPIHGIPATYDDKKPKVATALRKAFVAREGYTMVKIDFAGEELRIVTNLSREPAWIKEFNEGTGDLHTITAKAFFGPEITKQQRQMGKCVHPDTIISSNGTFMPLWKLGAFPTTEDTFIPWASSVFDGTESQPVTHLYNGGEKELFHVVVSGGILTCSGQHQLKTRDGGWVLVRDLEAGTLLEECQVELLFDGNYQTLTLKLWDGVPPLQFTPTHELSYFAGLYAGDGRGSSSCVSLTHGEPGKLDPYGTDYEEWREYLDKSLIACGFETSRKDLSSIYFGSTVVVRFLTELELHRKASKKLRIPSWVMYAGRTAALHYLGGIFDTDGTVGADSHNLYWTTKDFIFAGQVSTLLKSCGLFFNTELSFSTAYQRYYARLRLTVESSWKMRDYIRHPGKKARLREPMQAGKTKDRFQVVKVLPAGVGPCLDITMGTEEHQYQANGFISHNSANFSLVYGGGTMAIMRATKCTQQEAARRKAAFDKAMPVFNEWVKRQKALVKKDKGVFTAFGRWMAVPDVDSQDKAVVAACERYSLNYPIQGCICSVSQVLTNRGYQKIGALVKLGESFITWTGSKWAKAVAKPMGECQLAELTLSDGTVVRCDTRHKQLGVTSEGYQWVAFDNLCEGLQVATSLCYPVEFSPPPLPRMKRRVSSRKTPQICNVSDFWYWMGRYIGDGWLDPKGGICYSFGSHERVAINKCMEFWRSCGLDPHESSSTHTPKKKTSTRYLVDIWSVDLLDWLGELGFHSETAHTKRLPMRILQESLEYRKSFIRGVMDSDGHKPPMVSAKGNPYNIHLCQRPLLEDLKLLFRTLGVESIIRGPYKSGSDKNGEDTTSYRLDLNRRMFERNVQGVQNRGPKFHDMFAPDFLVQDFLSRGKWFQSDFRDDSSYVLYRRLVNGGKVTVYTLDDLCKQVGITLRNPIYGHKKIKKIKILDQVEETYTLSVQDPLHRFEADGVITKNSGADIMKMSMVMLYKRFYKMGWLQDNTARFLLTVHDELVFEVKHEKLMEVMPVLTEIMCSPAKMARGWPVLLEVEPLLDLHWDPKYDYYKIMHGYIPEKGKPPKETDIEINGRYYQPIPPWLEGHLVPDYMQKGGVPQTPPAQESPPSNTPSISGPPTEVKGNQALVSPTQVETLEPSRALVPLPTRPSSPPNGNGRKTDNGTGVLTYHISPYNLTLNTVKQVSAACMRCQSPQGKILHLLESDSNETLIDPALQIKVDPNLFKLLMDDHNL